MTGSTLPEAPEDGDERRRGAREFDLLVALLTGAAVPGRWTAEVIVPFHTAAGGDLELAEIPGLGPILPATARDLLAQADTVHQVAVDDTAAVIAVSDPIHPTPPAPAAPDPERAQDRAPEPGDQPRPAPERPAGRPEPRRPAPRRVEPGRLDPRTSELLDRLRHPPVLRELRSTGYQVSRRLRRYLDARDRTCVFPGCPRPARCTDKDHRIPWPTGATSADNLASLCRHHHRAKHAAFTLTRNPDGSHTWTTRGGWRFHRPAQGH